MPLQGVVNSTNNGIVRMFFQVLHVFRCSCVHQLAKQGLDPSFAAAHIGSRVSLLVQAIV